MTEESKKAFRKYGHFNSTHEVYGVLIEEVEEFFDLVRLPGIDLKEWPEDFTNVKIDQMIDELKQIQSICERTIHELENNQIRFV